MLERWSTVYMALAKHRNDTRVLVGPDVDLIVEGFPRCGNSYLVAWIEQANPGLRVASHLHSYAHVRAALRQGVPTVVVTRDPEDAVASEIVRATFAGGTTTAWRLLWRYARFHRAVARWADDVILSPFATTTGHPDLVAAALRDRAGLDIEIAPPHGAADVVSRVEEYSVAAIGRVDEMAVGRPSAERTAVAEAVKRELRDRHARRIDDLRTLHDALVSGPTAVHPVPDPR
jgi:hypothetical protein